VTDWTVERVVHFEPADFVRDGVAHFGFHQRGRSYAIWHQRHCVGEVDDAGELIWTAGAHPIDERVPNITAQLAYPMFIDELPDGALVVSNFGSALLVRLDITRMSSSLLMDGHALGMADTGNCVVDPAGSIWVNEVTGCRVWHLDPEGRVLRVIGDGTPGFEREPVDFEEARFRWIYDLRCAPDGRIFVLDSRNFAIRVIDPVDERVVTIAGTGSPGYDGDGGPARDATFGGDPSARFDGPISMSLDEAANVYVGDRWNHVVRRIGAETGSIETIAGRSGANDAQANDPAVRDPRTLNLPQISSMDYDAGRLYVPTDLDGDRGDLVMLRRTGA
jgi:hypothetical protein